MVQAYTKTAEKSMTKTVRVFIPKYRRKIMYGKVKKDVVEIIRKLCAMKSVELMEGAVCKDHVHICAGIPPKLGIS